MDANSTEMRGFVAGRHRDRGIEISRRWKYLLDEVFRIPGTKLRFGWDPLIGFIPGFGDLVTALTSLFLVFQAFRLRVPNIIKARMLLNVLIDVVIGSVPLVGDLFDFAWKSNSMNFALLEKHAGTGAKPGLGDWAFVIGITAGTIMIMAIPIVLLILLIGRLESWTGRPLF